MDARIDPLDESTHHEMVDLIRQSEWTEALVLFRRMIRLAHVQGQTDAHVETMRRISNGLGRQLENQVAYEASVLAERRIEQ